MERDVKRGGEILLVEDSRTYAQIIGGCLQTWGYQFTALSNGSEAWTYLQERHPTIVLLDWNLPGLNGIDLCRQIRDHEGGEYVYIIMLTSMTDQHDVMAGFDAGVDDYITKPFERELLQARIKVGWRINELQRRLVDTARRAGMAEVATSVLHSVGNVLNSAVTASATISETIQRSRVQTLSKLVDVITEHRDDMAAFVSTDPRGRGMAELIVELGAALSRENETVRKKLTTLVESHGHIRQIIALQQTYAGVSGVKEQVSLASLVADAAQLYSESFRKHRIDVRLEDPDGLPELRVEKHKVLQIVMNLLQNARDALRGCSDRTPEVVFRFSRPDAHHQTLHVVDNGEGIARDNLDRVFNYGFTTKRGGHGFGLHGCANLAREMGGKLAVTSDGPGTGAAFSLTLPAE